MKDEDFLNQKVKDITIGELANAIKIKLKQQETKKQIEEARTKKAAEVAKKAREQVRRKYIKEEHDKLYKQRIKV